MPVIPISRLRQKHKKYYQSVKSELILKPTWREFYTLH